MVGLVLGQDLQWGFVFSMSHVSSSSLSSLERTWNLLSSTFLLEVGCGCGSVALVPFLLLTPFHPSTKVSSILSFAGFLDKI